MSKTKLVTSYLIIAILCATTPVLYAAQQIRWIFIAALAGVGLFHLWNNKPKVITLDSVNIAALSLFLWMVISVSWSPDKGTGLTALIRMFPLFLIFFVTRLQRDRLRYHDFVLVGNIAVSIILLIAALFPISYAGYANDNMVTEALLCLVAFSLPSIQKLASSIRIYVILNSLAVAIYLFIFSESRLEYLGFPVMLILFAGYRFLPPRLCGRLYLVSLVGLLSFFLLLLFVPNWPFLKELGSSFTIRIPFYLNAFSMWQDAPLLGHGLGSFTYLSPLYQESWLTMTNGALNFPLPFLGNIKPERVHNEFLQILVEFGIVGLALFVVLTGLLIKNLLKAPREPFVEALFIVVHLLLFLALIEFPFQQPVTALFFIFCLAAVPTSGKIRIPIKTAFVPAQILATGFFLLICLIGNVLYTLSLTQHGMANGIIHQAPKDALRLHQRAYHLWPYHVATRRDLFSTLNNALRKGYRIPHSTVQETFHLSANASPYSSYTFFLWVDYLVANGYFRDHVKEIETIFTRFKAQAPHEPQLWLTEAFYAAENRQITRAKTALKTFNDLTKDIRRNTTDPTLLKRIEQQIEFSLLLKVHIGTKEQESGH